MPDTFESLLVKLSRARVDFLVAGGVAVCLNGFVRTTQDLDLLVEPSPANLHRLLSCLADFGDGYSRELTAQDFPLEEGAVRVVEDFTVDLFTVMRSKTYQDFKVTARALDISDVTVCYLDPHALIELKSASVREKDQLDVAALRELVSGNVSVQIPNLVDLTPPSDTPPEESKA